jgi:tetratricopeptide (TPR) repeat protein
MMKKILLVLIFSLFVFGDDYVKHGDNEYSNGNFQKAIEFYAKAISANPKNIKAYNSRGVSYYELKNYTFAISDYTKALSLQPNNLGTIINRGVSYSRLGDYENASKDAQRACELGDCELRDMLKNIGVFVEE